MTDFLKEHWEWVRKSWTMWLAALLAAGPEIMAFLPSVKAELPVWLYDWTFRLCILAFVMTRIKTQMEKS
jgi:hypothetical protein